MYTKHARCRKRELQRSERNTKVLQPKSSLQLPFDALYAQDNRIISNFLGIKCAVLKSVLTGGTSKTTFMPLTTQRLNILADDCLPALFALWRLPFCTLRLTIQTPSITILLDVGHALLERIATLSTEEMSIMPIFTQGNHMLPNYRRLAMFASRCKVFMPVKVTVKPQSLVAIFCYSLSFYFRKLLSLCTAPDSVDTLSTVLRWFGTDFQGFKSSSAGEADKALRVEVLRSSAELHYTSFDWQLTLMAGSSCPFASL